ncbi:MAG: hypothetical protein RIQ93_2215 [Verrucomicrobiota bacterium]|jgi:hypothetical protein
MPERPPPAECANCGAEVPRSARSCPQCGADDRTGWREQSPYDGLDLPEESSPDESAPGSHRDVNGLRWYWWCVGVALILFLGLGALALLR